MPSITSQAVDAKLTRAAIFLVVTLNAGADAETTVRGLCADLSSLVRGVGFRTLDGGLSCVTGVGAAAVADTVQGFKYFDDRDLLGFVDGTENPVAQAAVDATLIGEEDAGFAGGSYVIVQKYLHDLDKWNAIPVGQQERIVGRKKLSDIELADAEKPAFAHNVLTNIEENGEQLEILRDNMPFGDVGKGEFGTYFIGYARSPSRIERMLRNMFVGNPPGNYDRLLDVSRAVTGSLFFVPTTMFLDAVTPQAVSSSIPPPTPGEAGTDPGPSRFSSDGSLRIGSLKEATSHE